MSPASRGPGRPPGAKAGETRKRIVQAARDVFTEVGYDAATFQEIAVRADVTRPAINHYFKSKRLLYREAVAQTNEMVVIAGARKAMEAGPLLARLDRFVDAVTSVNVTDRSAAAFLLTSVLESQRHPELRQDEHDALRHTRIFVTSAVEEAVQCGEIELAGDSAVEPVVDTILAMLWGMCFYAGFVGTRDELERATPYFRQLMSGRLWDLEG